MKPFIKAMEGFASRTGLLPEQVWDERDLPSAYMVLGKPTGSAMPLMGAHAEYIKLLRSVSDGQVFDLIPQVAQRYLGDRKECQLFEIWKPNRHARIVKKGYTLRIQVPSVFQLHWTRDGWETAIDTASSTTTFEIAFVYIPVPANQESSIRFTFFWPESNSWEGHDYEVRVEE